MKQTPLLALGQAVLRRLPAEAAHRATIAGLRAGLGGRTGAPHDPVLARSVLGLAFPTPIGLAAGFDKDARATQAYAGLGFGFVEIGTVTPLAQDGNARPRLFRLEADRAVVNRMGFNNQGIARCLERLAAQRRRGAIAIPVGINVGINKEGADPVRDYPALVRAAAPLADYVVINVSSPNTPGLRGLQDEDRLAAILDAVVGMMPEATRLFVKLSPDLADGSLASLVRIVAERGASGIIAANTTVSRPDTLAGRHAIETGGLSGRPLRARAKALLGVVTAARDEAQAATGRRLALISCGGIEDGQDVFDRLHGGADLVQLYTGFAYGGPTLLGRIERELAQAIRRSRPGDANGGTDPQRMGAMH